jgi:hypothetical protein
MPMEWKSVPIPLMGPATYMDDRRPTVAFHWAAFSLLATERRLAANRLRDFL